MKIRRIFIKPDEVDRERVIFSEHSAHYLKNVLRLGSGGKVHACDGICEYLVELVALENNSLTGRILEIRQTTAKHDIEIILAVSCVRPGPFEEILRHGTELGVSKFIPVLSARSMRRPNEKKNRWEAIVKSAAQQSGRLTSPEVEAPLSLDLLLAQRYEGYSRLILSLREQALPFIQVLMEDDFNRTLVLIGPEGGFDDTEEETALAAGFKLVSLGERVLRTETAAILAAGTLMLYRAAGEGIRLQAARSDHGAENVSYTSEHITCS